MCVGAFVARGQNLVTNGDFETAPFAPSSMLTGWTVGATAKIHSAPEGSTTPTHSAALNIGGDSEGTPLSQSFTTVNGQTYTLDFDAGIEGQRTGTLQLQIAVDGNASIFTDTVSPPAVGST